MQRHYSCRGGIGKKKGGGAGKRDTVMHYLVALENRALKLVERPNRATNNAYEDCGRLEEE